MDAFYDQVAAHLELADWFGRNLAALADVLRGGCGKVDPDEVTFVWTDHEASRQALGEKKWAVVMEIFAEAAAGADDGFGAVLEEGVELVLA